ncbi:F0F1 ATP synthase subunit alpha [Candidatus Daviesbacteria bacterium]|nr:F0F1 ATP synthase subunit alpha [Candidatus Daviesbacteria bacterium]
MNAVNSQEVGFVSTVNDFLIYLDGLPTIRVNDIVENEAGVRAWISSISENRVQALLLDEGDVKPGQLFKRRTDPLSINIGDYLLSRAINPLGIAIDGKGLFNSSSKNKVYDLDKQAPGIKSRQFISNQFETGITILDMLIPIGKGQRQLIVGDARSGKGSFIIDMIVNQKNTNVVCIYGAIGRPISHIRNVIDVLNTNKALDFTIIVAAASSDPPPLIYLVPQTAFTIAEYFQKKGKDVLLILDDMGNHAKIYREIALIGNKSPGRESYPGDIFYQHAHLLERAGNFKQSQGGGSITALPVIEINLNDFTGFIPTNLMAMTDGHLLFRSSLYNQGQRPAIDMGLSVSRVGLQTQSVLQKRLASRIKAVLTQANQLRILSRFSTELSPESQQIQKQGQLIEELIKQEALTYVPKEVQMIMLSLVFTDYFKNKEITLFEEYKRRLIQAFKTDTDLKKLTSQAYLSKSLEEFDQVLKLVIPKLELLWQH